MDFNTHLDCDECIFFYNKECMVLPEQSIFYGKTCPSRLNISRRQHMNPVFVYGTLKKNHGNHILLENEQFLGNAVTEENFLLLEAGLPFVVDDTNHECSVPIHGEVYNVIDDVLNDLDQLEGHPHFYKRELVYVRINEEQVAAWIYFINDNFINNECYTINNSGVFIN